MSDVLDDFSDISGWLAVTSGESTLDLVRDRDGDRAAMRLDFDFKGGGGFVVARKLLRRTLPPTYTLSFRVRGDAPANRLELKLVDDTGRNVWWYRREAFSPPGKWTTLSIPSRDIVFAWGPAGGGTLTELGAVELAVTAPPGGRGTLAIADFRFEDRSAHPAPLVSASRHAEGHAPDALFDDAPAHSYRSGTTAGRELIEIDLGVVREHGGLVIEWEQARGARDYDVRGSVDGQAWCLLRSARGVHGTRSYVFAEAGGEARYLRLELLVPQNGAGYGILKLELLPYEASRSIESFFTAIAAREPRGRYPRWLHREQSYWTPIGVGDGGPQALINEDGLVEVDRGTFSLEPILVIDGTPITWAEADALGATSQSLEAGRLPIPSVVWRQPAFVMSVTAFATRVAELDTLVVRYRLENAGAQPLRAALYVCARPFQVNPPWQAFKGMGGVARIETIEVSDGVVWVNGGRAIVPSLPPARINAVVFDDSPAFSRLVSGELPSVERVDDPFGYAAAALGYELELDPDEASEVYVSVPFGEIERSGDLAAKFRRDLDGARAFERATSAWHERLSAVTLETGAAAPDVADAVATAAAHVLANRRGPALEPGPRRYRRSWIRDAATMSAALLRMGRTGEVRDFVRWYLPYQARDGNVPCCVDEQGPDWLVEHDSHGQLIYTVMEYYRFTRDRALLEEAYPAVSAAAGYMASLCAKRTTADYTSETKAACYGLLPESVSHEGYLAQPVHAYWDDFWAYRGLGDAAEIATELGAADDAQRFLGLQRALGSALYASIDKVIAKHSLPYVPGSVEWADFDPSATATALHWTDAAEKLPKGPLDATFEEYMRGFRRRRDGEIDWSNYTAYEIRIVGALVRLGRRAEANELIDYFLADRRPRAWNQWPEISWREWRSPGHLGDLPHSWISAEYVLAVLSMLAYERYVDGALVLTAGVPAAWLADGKPVVVEHLPTYYGELNYVLKQESESTLRISLTSTLTPPGGVVLRPPLSRPLAEVTVNGRRADLFDAQGVTLAGGPAEVVFRY